MMTTKNYFVDGNAKPAEPEAVAPVKRTRRTKEQMAADAAKDLSGSEMIAPPKSPLEVTQVAMCGDNVPPAQNIYIHAKAASDWLTNNLMPSTDGWHIGYNLAKALEEQK